METRMRITLVFNGDPKLSIEYTPQFWNTLKEKFECLGLRAAATENGWGKGVALQYYREREREFMEFLRRTNTFSYMLIDDINSPVFSSHEGRPVLNVALFRVIPTQNKVEIPIDRFLTVRDVMALKDAIAKTYSAVMNVVTGEVVMEVRA